MPEPITADCLAEMPSIAHGFFTRRGGVSTGVYASLNCGLGSHDSRDHVVENRARVARRLGVEGCPILTCHQVHSADAVVVEAPFSAGALPKADGLVTRVPGLVIGALAADCAPVLFCDPEARVIAACHAGWKGALGGILEATIAAMAGIGARRERIRAVLGPCIGPSAYEVGPEFEARFASVDPGYSAYFRRPSPQARHYFDLPAFVLARLAAARLETVESASICTYTSDDRLFSYRRATHRGESDYGRQISAIVLL